MTALNLGKLLEGNSRFMTEKEMELEANRRFIRLFPAEKKGWFIFKTLEYCLLTREQIKEVLVKNNLIKEGKNPEDAVNEVLKEEYSLAPMNELSATFEELKDGNNNKVYAITHHEPIEYL